MTGFPAKHRLAPAHTSFILLPEHRTTCSTFDVNRESSPRLSVILSEEQKLTEQLAGFTDISMKREALGLCRRFLSRKWISPDGFSEVVRVIGMFGIQARWAPRLEAAVARQSSRIRRALQGTMLFFYGARCDWKNALRFASMRSDLLPHEIAFAIEAFAHAGRTRELPPDIQAAAGLRGWVMG